VVVLWFRLRGAKEHLWSALGSFASAPPAERTLTGLAVLLQSQELKQALAPYCVGGPWGQLLVTVGAGF
jgi:type IV secretion system protein TrbE